jgi:oligoribonuclease (3'-5' exoribonuclease)
MAQAVFIKQLNMVTRLMELADQLKDQIGDLPAPWEGMKGAKHKAVRGVDEAFRQLAAYQRVLINKVPSPNEPTNEPTKGGE